VSCYRARGSLLEGATYVTPKKLTTGVSATLRLSAPPPPIMCRALHGQYQAEVFMAMGVEPIPAIVCRVPYCT